MIGVRVLPGALNRVSSHILWSGVELEVRNVDVAMVKIDNQTRFLESADRSDRSFQWSNFLLLTTSTSLAYLHKINHLLCRT